MALWRCLEYITEGLSVAITREAEWWSPGASVEAFLIESCLPAIWSRTWREVPGVRERIHRHVSSTPLILILGRRRSNYKKSEKRPGCGFVWLFLVGNHDTSMTGMLRTPISQKKDTTEGTNKNDSSVPLAENGDQMANNFQNFRMCFVTGSLKAVPLIVLDSKIDHSATFKSLALCQVLC